MAEAVTGIRTRRRGPSLPTEHGFWVMLAAPVFAAWLRVGLSPRVALASALVIAAVILGAAVVHRRVRRSGALQLALAVALGLVGAPVEWAGGTAAAGVLAVSAAWMAIYLSTTLVVRATFARAARGSGSRSRALLLRFGAVAVGAAAAAGFALGGRMAEATACATASVTCAALAWLSPTVKQLKLIGLALTGSVFLCALALSL